MFLVGLTGGIATGKSTVSKMMQEQGVPVVDADVIARQVVEPGTRGWRQVKQVFGPDVFLESGDLDRTKLGKIIFSDPLKRKQLNKITHGKIQRRVIWETIKLFFRGHSFVILDLPLLFESGVAVDFMEKIIVVSCLDQDQLERLVDRSGQSPQDCRDRIASQMPLRLKCQNAHFVIDNSGSRAETADQVRRVLGVLSTSRAHWRVRALLLLAMAAVSTLLVWLASLRLNSRQPHGLQ